MLAAERISKTLHGRKILDDISLTLCEGTVYGFTGPNGCGKTMLFRALSGLMRIDEGKIFWNDKRLHKDFSVIPKMGMILEQTGLYPDFTGMENLMYLASLRKIIGKNKVCEAIRRVGLDPDDRRTYGKYSLGMRQRIALAQAIMEKPDVLFLDEPTNALDEQGLVMLRNIVQEEKKRGALILLASHSRYDIDLLSDEIIRIDNGRLR